MCAADTCIGTCEFCAVAYHNTVLDHASGRCCDRILQGECINPRSGEVTDEPYGFPDHKPANIFEGTVAYKNGPSTWSPENPSGSYGFTFNAPPDNGNCPSLPPQFDSTLVKTMSLKDAGSHANGCFIACNLTEVSATGKDPCAVGSVNSPTAGPAKMSCYSGGDNWLKPPHTGMCGFNCTLRNTTTYGATCTSPAGGCELACNTLDWYSPT